MLYGKDFSLDDNARIVFKEGIIFSEPDIRKLGDAKPVLLDGEKVEGNSDMPLYYMYRNVCKKEHLKLFDSHNIRYDMTVILAGTIGREYIKTIGHFHPVRTEGEDTYPEYYEVLYGEALYILQKNSRSGDVEEIMAVEAKSGDKVFVPPGFGHVTINPGETPLVMANLVESTFSSIYEPFREKKGAAYYYVQAENGKGDFIRNKHYHHSVGLEITAAPNLPQPVKAVEDLTLYEAFVNNPESFNILK